MVFHESKEVGVIIMLTQTVEAGREKCAQYFPLHQDQPSMDILLEEPFDAYVGGLGVEFQVSRSVTRNRVTSYAEVCVFPWNNGEI